MGTWGGGHLQAGSGLGSASGWPPCRRRAERPASAPPAARPAAKPAQSRATKEMIRPLSTPPACHLFGCKPARRRRRGDGNRRGLARWQRKHSPPPPPSGWRRVGGGSQWPTGCILPPHLLLRPARALRQCIQHHRGHAGRAVLSLEPLDHDVSMPPPPVLSVVHRHHLAGGEAFILLHPPLPFVGVSIGIERGRQQNGSLANG